MGETMRGVWAQTAAGALACAVVAGLLLLPGHLLTSGTQGAPLRLAAPQAPAVVQVAPGLDVAKPRVVTPPVTRRERGSGRPARERRRPPSLARLAPGGRHPPGGTPEADDGPGHPPQAPPVGSRPHPDADTGSDRPHRHRRPPPLRLQHRHPRRPPPRPLLTRPPRCPPPTQAPAAVRSTATPTAPTVLSRILSYALASAAGGPTDNGDQSPRLRSPPAARAAPGVPTFRSAPLSPPPPLPLPPLPLPSRPSARSARSLLPALPAHERSQPGHSC